MDMKYDKNSPFVRFYLQLKLSIEHNCMVSDNAMGRISSSDYLMQIPWGEIRYLLFVCWHRKYCISIENYYWSYLKRRKSVIYHDLYLFLFYFVYSSRTIFSMISRLNTIGTLFDDWIGNLVKYKHIHRPCQLFK